MKNRISVHQETSKRVGFTSGSLAKGKMDLIETVLLKRLMLNTVMAKQFNKRLNLAAVYKK